MAAKAATKRAVIAYVTRDLPLKLRSGDILIADASPRAIKCGETSASVLRQLFDRGVCIYSYMGLHAKVVVLDNIVVTSSANLSDQSVQGKLLEAGVLTDNPGAVAGAISLVHQLKGLSEALTNRRLKRLEQIPVVRTGVPPMRSILRKRRPRVKAQSTAWIFGVSGFKYAIGEADQKEVDSGSKHAETLLSNPDNEINWVRCAKKSRIAKGAKEGDTVILLWRSAKAIRSPQLAYAPSPILYWERGKRFDWLFYEDPPDAEDRAMKWGHFQGLSKRIGLPFKVTKNSERQVPEAFADALHSLWNSTGT